MDLIYEGITTAIDCLFFTIRTVRMDLIYEGITTVIAYPFARSLFRRVRMDLIYEGITTPEGTYNLKG